jgi:hypothetical protein
MRAFIRKTKNKGVNMKPIRKNELEHWALLIDRKFEARGAELERQFETEVDKLTENTFGSFKRKIKVDSFLNQFAKDKKNYDDFVKSKESKEFELERLKNISRSKLCDYLENFQTEINGIYTILMIVKLLKRLKNNLRKRAGQKQNAT